MTICTLLPCRSSVSARASMEPIPSPSGRTWVVSRKRCRRRTRSTRGNQSSGIGALSVGGNQMIIHAHGIGEKCEKLPLWASEKETSRPELPPGTLLGCVALPVSEEEIEHPAAAYVFARFAAMLEDPCVGAAGI